MTDTLSDVIYALGNLLGGAAFGTATGGSTTTIVDSSRAEANDHWNRGTALIVTDAGGAGAAPEGQFSVISDWVLSSTTATIGTLSSAVGAGDTYMLIPPRWPLEMLKNKINLVLRSILIPQIDITSLDTADNQTEYSLPTTCPGHNLRRVFIETNDDSNDRQWHELRDWEVIVQATGTQDVLLIPQFSSGWDIRLDYVAPHPTVTAYNSNISEAVHINRIIYHAALLCVVEEIGQNAPYKNVNSVANFYSDLAQQAEVNHPVIVPPINGRIKTYGTSDYNYTGEVGKVRL